MSRPPLRERFLARLSALLGFTPAPPPPVRPELTPLLMPAMLRTFGFDPRTFRDDHPDLAHVLDDRCASCAIKGLCLESLAREATPEGVRGFCPNAPIFDALRE